VNDWFEGRYAIARETIEARLFRGEDPVLVRTDAELVMLHRGRRRSEALIPERYDEAKAIAHLPAAVYLLLSGCGAERLDAQTLELTRTMREELDAVAAEGDGAVVLRACLEVLVGVLEEQHVPPDVLGALASRTEAPVRALIREATEVYVARLEAIVGTWTEEWTEREWERVLVVICAGHAPRYKESTKSYFQRLLGERHERGPAGEEQVIYAEGAAGERDALELAATHLLNRELGRVFLGSTVALQEDVLGDTTQDVLDEHFD